MKKPDLKIGFTLLELLIIIGILVVLSTVVTVRFATLRQQQEIYAEARELTSKIREIQNFVLSGKITAQGQAAEAYEISLTYPAQTFSVNYIIRTSVTTTQTYALETVNMNANVEVNELRVSGNPKFPVLLRFEAPFGKVVVDGQANRILTIRLAHKRSGQTRTITVDGISGRIGN